MLMVSSMWISALVSLLIIVCVVGQNQNAAGPWWSNAVYYRILVDSFRDGDGDGLGDLQGATKQISYVRALGADAVILSSISSRSTECNSSGIINHVEIDTRYGNIEAFSTFVEKSKKLGLKLVTTLNLQTISTTSEWFTSSAEKINGYEDRILWRVEVDDETKRLYDSYTWIWHEGRKAFYASINNEAVLNLCSDSTTVALSTAQCGWLRRGVSGVLLNPDFPIQVDCGEKLLKKLASDAIACARSSSLETPAILVESSLSAQSAALYYADGGVGANSVLSNALTTAERSSASELGLAFYATILNTPMDSVPTWMTSTSSQSRVATRYGSDMVDTINILAMVLSGAAVINQGDDLGAVDTIPEWAATDKCMPMKPTPWMSPFPWDDTLTAGFTTGEPWIPLAPNYRYANAKVEFNNDISHASVLRVAAAIRKSPAIGPQVEIKRFGNVIAVLRWGGPGSLLVVANVGRDPSSCQVANIVGLPPEMTVAASSAGSSISPGSHISTDKNLKLASGETLLLVGPPRHCGGPGPVDRITNKLTEGWQKINKYFSN